MRIASCIALVIPLTVRAQHAFFHSFEYDNTAAGQSRIPGPLVHALYAPLPQYTRKARAAKMTGAVILEAALGADGCLRDVQIERRLGFGLDETAIEAVLRWRFKPFLKNGTPAETMVRGELYFDPAWSPARSLAKQRKCGEK